MGRYRSLCVLMVLMDPYTSLFVIMDSNVYLLVFIGLYACIWVLMGSY